MEAESADTLSPELLSQLALCGDAKWYGRNELLIVEGVVSNARHTSACRDQSLRARKVGSRHAPG